MVTVKLSVDVVSFDKHISTRTLSLDYVPEDVAMELFDRISAMADELIGIVKPLHGSKRLSCHTFENLGDCL